MDKQGLVAPVWSDAGETRLVVNWIVGKGGPAVPVYTDVQFAWDMTPDMFAQLFGQQKKADPNAKPSLPSLTREGGNKRGPGWCDEDA